MARILILAPAGAEPTAQRDLARVPDDDVAITWRAVPGARPESGSAAERAIAEIAMLDAGLRAEADGFDAVVVASFLDLGLRPLRSALSIPVLGAGRTGLLYALTLGSRFGIAAPRGSLGEVRAVLHSSGIEAACASLVPYDDDDDLPLAARACLDAGAEVLCVADMRPPPDSIRRAVPIPVIDALAVAVALAESLLALGLSHSARAHPAAMVRKDDLVESLARAAGCTG